MRTSLLLASLLLLAACGDSNAADTAGSGGGAAATTGGEGGNGGGGAAPACGGLTGSVISSKDFPADCGGLDEADALACGEKRFWLVLREDYAQRGAIYGVLSELITAWEGKADPKEVANLYFRRGQLALAMSLEDGDQQKVFQIEPDFDKALQLYPEHPVVPTWRDTIEIAFAVITKDNVKLKALFEKSLENVELCPLGNIPSLTGTTIGAPLSTGIPQKTLELAKSWKCEGVTWCTDNTWKGPYAVAGMRYHMGEAFARMGQKDEALAYFNSATEAPDFAAWPYAGFVQDKITNIDAFLGEFAALGQEGSAFDKMYSNSNFGCKFCHGVE